MWLHHQFAGAAKQVAFGVTTFVSPVRMVVKADSGIKTLDDLNGKAVATTTGTTSDRYIKQNEKGHNIDVKTSTAKTTPNPS